MADINDFAPEHKKYLQTQFKLFDKDNSDSIPVADLNSALCMCGLCPTAEHMRAAAERADENGTGLVTFDDFLNVVIELLAVVPSIDDLKNAFRAFDPDSRGTLSSYDLRHILLTMGDKLSNEEANQFFAECAEGLAVDVDGNVTYDEVCARFQMDFMK